MLVFLQIYVENIDNSSCNFQRILKMKVQSINVNKKVIKFTARVPHNRLVRCFRKANNECKSIC